MYTYQEIIPNKQGYFIYGVSSLENYCIFSFRAFLEYWMIGGGLGLGIFVSEREGTTNMGDLNISIFTV